MDKTLEKILDDHYLHLNDYTSLCPEMDPIYRIFSFNDKYLKISFDKTFWNVFDLHQINYVVEKDFFYIISTNKFVELYSRILSINGQRPWNALVNNKMKKFNIKGLDVNNNLIEFDLSKPKLTKNNIEENYYRLKNSYNYLRLSSFQHDIVHLLNRAQTLFDKKDLIIDLRNNQGGLLKHALILLEFLIPFGECIGCLQSKKGIFKITSKIEQKIKFRRIIIVMDRLTLSSSEFVIKSLQSNIPNCILVGEETGGKNVITNVFKVDDFFIKVPEYKHHFNSDLDSIIKIQPHIKINKEEIDIEKLCTL